MAFEVIMGEEAEMDLMEIYDHISESDNPKAAAHILDKIEERCLTLKTHPKRGKVLPELRELGITVFRETLWKPYRIIYEISGRTVFIHAVFDGRRDLQDVLTRRLLR